MELESEEQPLLRAAENRPTSPELPVLPAEPSAALPMYRWAPPPAMGASPPPGLRRSVPSGSVGPQSRAEGSPRSTRWHSRTSNRAGTTQPTAADARGSVRGRAGSPHPAGGQRGWNDGHSHVCHVCVGRKGPPSVLPPLSQNGASTRRGPRAPQALKHGLCTHVSLNCPEDA